MNDGCRMAARLTSWTWEYAQRVWDPDYTAPTMTCCIGGGMKTKILETPYNEKEGEDMTDENQTKNMKVRHLTPKEAWRLMDLCERKEDNGVGEPCTFDDTAFEKARAVNSDSQLYKQAGNSICVGVLESIFESMFFGEPKKGVDDY